MFTASDRITRQTEAGLFPLTGNANVADCRDQGRHSIGI
jgi:hypothetical protein